ncbi:hypothetical protein ACLOJK_034822 [Asimina triloba]
MLKIAKPDSKEILACAIMYLINREEILACVITYLMNREEIWEVEVEFSQAKGEFKIGLLKYRVYPRVGSVAGGAFMNKGVNEAFQLLEDMAANNYQWSTDR